MAEMVFQALDQAGRNFLQAVANLVPRAVLTISIVLVGWLIASVLRWLTRTLLRRLGFGRLCARQGVTDMLRAAELPEPERLVAAIVFWVVWIGFLLSGVDVLGLTAVRGMIDEFAVFVPRLMVAIVIVVVGVVFANVAWRATQLAHQLASDGATVVELPQTAKYISQAFDEFGAALKAGRFHHDGNPVLEWMASNVVAKAAMKGATVPSKEKPENKIDGAIALIMALGRHMVAEEAWNIDEAIHNPVIV